MSWRNESKRHSLARQGVRTGRRLRDIATSTRDISQRTKDISDFHVFLEPDKDTDQDGLINIHDCNPFSAEEQGKIHDFLETVFSRAKRHEKVDDAHVDEAIRESKRISSPSGLKNWWDKYGKKIAEAIGIAGLIVFVPELLGGAGAVIMTAEGTEIVGGTLAGQVARGIASFSKLPLKKEHFDKFVNFEVHLLDKFGRIKK
jgi:hypothetical protein